MTNKMKCGEATIKLIAEYGITTLFGIPGVHTLDFFANIEKYARHILTRHEQGAGFAAEGWARATGKPCAALVISGPGVTNIATPLAQAYADSLPLLLISAEPTSESLGKGWGVLHEITSQRTVTAPLTAFSATVKNASEVPELLAKAFEVFACRRPRPVHISIPIDVLAQEVDDDWRPTLPSPKPAARPHEIERACEMLKAATRPVIMVGGGAVNCAAEIRQIAEATSAIVCHSAAAKGVLGDSHPLSLGSMIVKQQGRDVVSEADVILAVGTELADPDSFADGYEINGDIIRIDIDENKLDDKYKAKLGIAADAKLACIELQKQLGEYKNNSRTSEAQKKVKTVRQSVMENLTGSEKQHVKILEALNEIAPKAIFAGDACQLVYTGQFAMQRENASTWFFGAGYCPLGNSIPNAIGAKLARPDKDVGVLIGDGGFMFTAPEIMTAVDLKMPLPIIVWDNNNLQQIKEGMIERGIKPKSISGTNPNFIELSKAFKCQGKKPTSLEELKKEWQTALKQNAPTIIWLQEGADWLVG